MKIASIAALKGLALVGLLTGCVCVYEGPVDSDVAWNQIPSELQQAARQELKPGEEVQSIVERRFRGRLVSYRIQVRSQRQKSTSCLFVRASPVEVIRDPGDTLTRQVQR